MVTVVQLNEYNGWYEFVVLIMYKQILKKERSWKYSPTYKTFV
ncbi:MULTISPECIES: hypothetical protein [Bacillus]|uniref:Uncharacterized protein n=1 Tax=Bacillus thuringiensis serovar toumanoffi TaxID=180862 RepID=A0ABD5HRF7_BACTU|nr:MULTISPECIES: hypothetical protein [Bacillus cereus group]EEM92684.1 hypothetical protein bthur0013_59700 [Bacillus thuringiensis IBL 200]EOO05811.1 hypothetical protein IAW_04894 [Bacillus cereus str. Schrouff]EOO81934.1 hypothetical protein IGY_05436 [Bacillus cereus K-5975c]MCU4836902.1 hypothetical protein [Bacillus cereus]MCU4886233.1 hypothetical protein [Bacillus cereus]